MDQSQEPGPTAICAFGIGPVDEPSDTTIPLSARDREAVDVLPAGSTFLIVQCGLNIGACFPLDAETISAGRSPKSDIFLDGVTVSHSHCQFIAVDGGYVVRDSGPLNGTYVNRRRMDSAHPNTGDEVQINKYRLTYQPPSRTA